MPEGELPLWVGTAQMTEEDILKEIPGEAKRLVVVTSEPVEKVVIEGGWQASQVSEFETIRVVWMRK